MVPELDSEPPAYLVMPAIPQVVFTIALATASFGIVVFTVIKWRRTGSPVHLLAVVGGALSVFNEPIVDLLGHLYHPEQGQWALFETFGRSIPVWVVFGYLIYFGGAGLVILEITRLQFTLRRFWIGISVVVVIDLILEVPLLASGVYTYYGYQPVGVGGLPLPWLFVNGVGALLGGLIIAKISHSVGGGRVVVCGLIPAASYYGGMAVGLPYFSAINSDLADGWKWVGGMATILLGLFVFHEVGKSLCSDPSVPSAGLRNPKPSNGRPEESVSTDLRI